MRRRVRCLGNGINVAAVPVSGVCPCVVDNDNTFVGRGPMKCIVAEKAKIAIFVCLSVRLYQALHGLFPKRID